MRINQNLEQHSLGFGMVDVGNLSNIAQNGQDQLPLENQRFVVQQIIKGT